MGPLMRMRYVVDQSLREGRDNIPLQAENKHLS